MYAGRKRRKPAARALHAADTGRSNPSKRHRERLNRELERLAALLPFPEEVAAGLDKLSILRLSAAFLRAKSFFRVALKNHGAEGAERDGDHESSPALGMSAVPEGELLLQALNGFVLVVTSEGLIFYSSHTIQDYLGFHQTDVMHQSIFKLIHTEDHQEFRRNLHWAFNPPQSAEGEPSPEGRKSLSFPAVAYKPDQLPLENSSFLERSFVCRFRCLLDNSSGFLALNLQGRLRFLHGQNKRSEDGSALPPQLALFAISTPLQPPSILEIRTKNMIFRTKHKLDFTPLACDAKGKIVLGYTEAELRMCGTGYQFVHAADMLYCAENHIRMMKTGESGLTVFRLLTKDKHWKWVQANARLVYKNSKPEYIIVTQRPLVDEEGGEHLRKRSMHLPFTFATGEALLYQSAFPLPGFCDAFQSKGKISKSKKTSHSNGGCSQKDSIAPGSLLSAVLQQDKAAYAPQPAPSPSHTFNSSFLAHLEDTSSLGAGRAWSTSTAPVSSRKDSLKEEWVHLQQEDPLLATLNSLTINSDESCSNNELFSALESLGLNAEDLELLLLDEKMVMVNTDPDHTLSLSDFLTNNEILSCIHTTPGNKHKEDLQARPPPGTTSSPLGCSAAYQAHAEAKDLQYPSQQTQQPGTVAGQAAALLWEHPLYDALAQQSPLPLKPTEAELPAGLQSRGAGEEDLLRFLHLSQVAPWTVAPSSHLGAPPQAQQLDGDFPAVHPTPEDVLQTFSLPGPGRGRGAAPSQPKHKAGRRLLMNRLCAHHHPSAPRFLPTSSSSSPWQDYVSPLLTSSAQPDFYGISQDLICQRQDYVGPVPGPAVPALGSSLNGLCSMDAVDSERSQEEMVPYSGLFPSSSYQLIPETHPSSIPCMYPFLSSSAEHFGSTGGVLEAPANSYGLFTSILSQENSHKPDSSCVLPGSHTGLPTDVPKGSPAPPCKLHPHAEVLPDHPHTFSGDFYL
ncbi:aryl hydrocarbon receptor-like [Tympanuchus pallidicinctus]|uniref:aryl hydrocarbon receptor-like n=1 Tax=Tympanuchus pallidicinctus TaxID=109042 RepID=UPI0022872839|nr:aryl hydrocarbon receptor-like [Tympanuchus pallidicinctus]